MDKIGEPTIDMKLEKLRSALTVIKFSEDEIEKQLSDVRTLLSFKIVRRFCDKSNLEGITDQKEIKQRICQKYSPEKIQKIVEEVSIQFIEDYLRALTKNLSMDDLQKFLGALKMINE